MRDARSVLLAFAVAATFAAPAFAQAPSETPPPATTTTDQPPPSTPPPVLTPATPAPVAPATTVVVAPPPAAPSSTSQPFVQLTSLRLMRDKGLITQAEYDSAVRDLGESVGAGAGDAPTVMLGRWSTTLYGFVEADHIYDSTESFNDIAGNAQVARPLGVAGGVYAGTNDRLTFSLRNSRIGFKLRAPEWHRVRASAQLEMDFLGNQPPTATESQFFTNPTFRIRHFFLKMETPIVDILVGQYWQLFGWQSLYHPNTVEIQGVPGQIYSRTPQIRVSKSFGDKTDPVTFEVAIAMMRPPQRDSATPEGQAGVRLAINKWTGTQTMGSTGSTISPLSFAITADVRQFNVAEFAMAPQHSVGVTGWGVAADGFIPIIPGTKEHKGNSLSLNGEFAYGYGTADLYTGLGGGVGNIGLPPNMMGMPQTYTPNVDPGLVQWAKNVSTGMPQLLAVHWMSYLVGAQYYFPGLDGKLWISANYSRLESNNSLWFGAATKVRTAEDWADGNLFVDVTAAVRLGLEYALFLDHYADGTDAKNHRVQLSAFYIF